MQRDWLRILLGVIVNLEIWFMLTCNIVSIICIYRGRLFNQKENPVFLISGLNIIVETIQLILHLIYVGPSILLGSWVFPPQSSLPVLIASLWFLFCWYLSSFNQIIMALNRFSVVFFPRLRLKTKHFMFLFFSLGCLSFVMVLYSQVLSPCCRLTPDPSFFGYSYMPSAVTENTSMKYVDVPLDAATSVICIISYISLFSYIFRMRRTSTNNVKSREIRLCIQFLIVFFTYTVTWSTFFFFPLLRIPFPEAYVTTTIVFMANCGINSVIYLTMNKEVRKEFDQLFRLQKQVTTLHSHSVRT